MDDQEIRLVICKQELGPNSSRYYIAVVNSEIVGENNTYLKPNGMIERWVSANDYFKSYQDCVDAILMNHEIIEEVPTPLGYIEYASAKEM